MRTVSRLIAVTAGAMLAQIAVAKLPPLSEDAKATAAEAALKADHAGKVAGFELCRAQDRVAEAYRRKLQAEGKTPNPPSEVPPCADPGGLPSPAAAGLEKAGAHSNPAGGSSPTTTAAAGGAAARPAGAAASAPAAASPVAAPVQQAPAQKKP